MMHQYVTAFRAMGCWFHVWLATGEDGGALLRQVPGWVEAWENSFSRFRPESELSRLNASAGQWVTVSPDLLDVVLVALDVAQFTDGLVTPLVLPALMAAGYDRSFERLQARQSADLPRFALSVPDWQSVEVDVSCAGVYLPPATRIDLGGVAKGWTAEAIADRLEAFGPCLVDAGGDIVARGCPPGQEGWPVIVADPWGAPPDAPLPEETVGLLTLCVRDRAVATSGIDYRRWWRGGRMQHHLIDPRTGAPAETDLLSATVIARDADRAEGCAKALMILGSEAGLDWFLQNDLPDSAALVVRQDGAVLATESLAAYRLAPVERGCEVDRTQLL
ncbi:MAG: FAD:protein FMN transferase [Anaerolineae bacterium]